VFHGDTRKSKTVRFWYLSPLTAKERKRSKSQPSLCICMKLTPGTSQ
jgi:hypothetical protein